MAGRRQAVKRNPKLQRFVIPEVRPTGRQLGVGSYGSVEELEMNGLVCAGKRLHDALLQRDNAGVANIERKYIEECQVMAELRHPHIVQFLGLCFLEGSALPVLVMERLDSSLDELLEGLPGLPLALKRSLLADVARGLLYLHTRNPPVVHRDLSARNVLLTSSQVAKISDLGNARIVNLRPGQLARTLTHLPGTMVYMPPEAFEEGSRYGPRLDIFSFGHLTLFTLTQVFPGSLLSHTYPDPQNPDHLLVRSEVERRRNYIQQLHGQLGEEHPLVRLVHQCLHNIPNQRPSAEEVLQQLEAVRAQTEGPYGQSVRVIVDMEKVRVLRGKDAENERLQQQVQRLEVEVEAKDTQLQQQDIQLQQKDSVILSVQEEYDCLKVVQSQQISEHQQRLTDATTAQREAELNVAMLTEKLTQLQQQMSEREEGLCGEVTQLKEELMSEQTQTERVARALEATKTELAGVQEELEREKQAKEEAVTGRQAIQEKSKTFIAEQQQQMERLNQAKEGAEQQVRDLLRQIASLKSRLENTEATQKDFIQLAQSLQVRLAEIEEERQANMASSPEHAPL